MEKVHVLKLNSEYFEEAYKGVKPWECRLNDRDYNVGDKIILQEINDGGLTGREIHGVITYILNHAFIGLKAGYVVFTYEETCRVLSGVRLFDNKHTTKEEMLDTIISDMDDTIDDYRDTIKNATRYRVNKDEYKHRLAEVKSWRESLSQLREELSL